MLLNRVFLSFVYISAHIHMYNNYVTKHVHVYIKALGFLPPAFEDCSLCFVPLLRELSSDARLFTSGVLGGVVEVLEGPGEACLSLPAPAVHRSMITQPLFKRMCRHSLALLWRVSTRLFRPAEGSDVRTIGMTQHHGIQ